jgi:Pyruvate:ferredoxin oxidoreductase and related 2-oxoacid:ferredoxin oxidoreductases, gamma subunit
MQGLDIMIVGVGGQGTLLASRVLGAAALNAGFDVKVSEVHGMSQRGGSVVTYVRFGQKVASPLIDKGDADIILSFEALEALRFLEYLKPDGTIIANEQQIDPMPVITGAEKYPEGIIDILSKGPIHTVTLDAAQTARECGDLRAVNIVLIGVMAGLGLCAVTADLWREAVKSCVPQKALEINLKAFDLGYERGGKR